MLTSSVPLAALSLPTSYAKQKESGRLWGAGYICVRQLGWTAEILAESQLVYGPITTGQHAGQCKTLFSPVPAHSQSLPVYLQSSHIDLIQTVTDLTVYNSPPPVFQCFYNKMWTFADLYSLLHWYFCQMVKFLKFSEIDCSHDYALHKSDICYRKVCLMMAVLSSSTWPEARHFAKPLHKVMVQQNTPVKQISEQPIIQ